MKIEYILVGVLFLLSLTNMIIYKKKTNLIKMIIGFLMCLAYLAFIFIPILEDYLYIYDICVVGLIVLYSLLYLPKKITKNITEYDYFELEKSYHEIEDDKERLRQRYLSTIALVDEGIIFYEDDGKRVILSDKAHDIFGGPQAGTIEEHSEVVDALDRTTYLKAIDRVSKKSQAYEIKYRINKDGEMKWVLERGHFIGVGGKRSLIAVCMILKTYAFASTDYFDVDSLYKEEQLIRVLKDLNNSHKSYSLVYFELTNVPSINSKFGREVGNLMMNDYIRFLKTTYAKDITRLFRISGIKFAMVIDDKNNYEDFHKALLSNGSMLYNIKIQIAGIKDVVMPNFGVVNITGEKINDIVDIMKLANKSLSEAVNATRRSFSIFGE